MNKKVVASYIVIFIVGLFLLISAACSGISKVTLSQCSINYNGSRTTINASTSLDIRSFYGLKSARITYQIFDENGVFLAEKTVGTDYNVDNFSKVYLANEISGIPSEVRVSASQAKFKNGWVYAVSSILMAGSLLFFLKDYLAYRKVRQKALAESDLSNRVS